MPTRKRNVNRDGEAPQTDVAVMRAIIRDEILREMKKNALDPQAPKPAVAEDKKTKRELQIRIGANVRRLRTNAGLNQSEIARQLPKCSPSRINNLESGRIGVSIPWLRKLAHILNVDVSEFFKIMVLLALMTGIAVPDLLMGYLHSRPLVGYEVVQLICFW